MFCTIVAKTCAAKDTKVPNDRATEWKSKERKKKLSIRKNYNNRNELSDIDSHSTMFAVVVVSAQLTISLCLCYFQPKRFEQIERNAMTCGHLHLRFHSKNIRLPIDVDKAKNCEWIHFCVWNIDAVYAVRILSFTGEPFPNENMQFQKWKLNNSNWKLNFKNLIKIDRFMHAQFIFWQTNENFTFYYLQKFPFSMFRFEIETEDEKQWNVMLTICIQSEYSQSSTVHIRV